MEYAPIGLLIPPPLPPFPPSSHGVDLSALEFVLGVIGVIAIPLLIYTFVASFASSASCPSFSTARGRSSSGEAGPVPDGHEVPAPAAAAEADGKLGKEAEGECPVCLSAFGEAEEVKQLSACKHYFHAPCIDAWLSSHSSCPVCRALIVSKWPPSSKVPAAARDSDHLQGLPDASSLV